MKSANYCKFQSAYCKGYATEEVLLTAVSDILKAAGNGQCTAVLALDTSSFNAIDHATLINLACTVSGIQDGALDGLQSFVTERT